MRDLRAQVAPSAELVGTDVTATFLPEASEDNIKYEVYDVCTDPQESLKGRFDYTNARLVLPFTGKVGPDNAVANMAGKLIF